MSVPGENFTYPKSKFCIAPLPQRVPAFTLGKGSQILGRRILRLLPFSGEFQRMKNLVSRQQLIITVSETNKVSVKVIGMHPIHLIKVGESIPIVKKKGDEFDIELGDIFTLYRTYYSFVLATGVTPESISKGIKKLELEEMEYENEISNSFFPEKGMNPSPPNFFHEINSIEEDRPSKKPKITQELSETKRETRASNKSVFHFDWGQLSDSESEYDSDDLVDYSKRSHKKKSYKPTVVELDELSVRKTLVLYHEVCLKHLVPKGHKEVPERLEEIIKILTEMKKKYSTLVVSNEITDIDEEFLLKAHSADYLTRIQKLAFSQKSGTHYKRDVDTFISENSMEAALKAASSVCEAINQVSYGNYRNVFCAIRPPGHHCGFYGQTQSSATQGYCILNNVAIGAFYARDIWDYKRIAVVDFDVHHGNGTEELLQGKENFLFISIHVGDIYPETGKEIEERHNNVLCISLSQDQGSTEFIKAFDEKIIPKLNEFKPDLLITSSGFDGHKRDPTGALKLTEKDFFLITEKLKLVARNYCSERFVSVLEGGYHRPSLRNCVQEHILSLLKK